MASFTPSDATSIGKVESQPSSNQLIRRAINSCFHCRRRKIRCTRERPKCQNCVKIGHRCEYISLSTYGDVEATPQLPLPQVLDTSIPRVTGLSEEACIKARLTNLEDLMRKLLQRQEQATTNIARSTGVTPKNFDSEDNTSPQVGVTITVDGEPRYVVGSYWHELIAHAPHEDLNVLLHEQQDSDVEGADTTTAIVEPATCFLFAQADAGFSRTDYLPNMDEARWLYEIFTARVDPIARLIHKPSFTKDLDSYYTNLANQATPADQYAVAGASIDSGFGVLLFAIFYAAINSLQDGQEPHDFNLSYSHSAYLARMKFATEQSLLRSKILEKPSLNSVTAFCLLVFVMCCEADVPNMYALTGTLLRISRSLSLHIDPFVLAQRMEVGTARYRGKQLDVVEAERRRRLWHLILHLNFMVCEAHGTDPEHVGLAMWPDGVGTAHPFNVDDEELQTGLPISIESQTQFPEDRGRVTDMTMYLVRLEISECFRQLASMPLSSIPGTNSYIAGRRSAEAAAVDSKILIETMTDKINNLYVRYCLKSDPVQTFTITLGEVAKQKALLVYYSQNLRESKPQSSNTWPVARRQAMTNAINLLSTYRELLEDPKLLPLLWHAQRHSQFHAIIYVLKEMLVTDPVDSVREIHQLCKQAWDSVTRMLLTMSRLANRAVVSTVADERVLKVIQSLSLKVQQRWFPSNLSPVMSAHMESELVSSEMSPTFDASLDFDAFLRNAMDFDFGVNPYQPLDMGL